MTDHFDFGSFTGYVAQGRLEEAIKKTKKLHQEEEKELPAKT